MLSIQVTFQVTLILMPSVVNGRVPLMANAVVSR